MSSFVVDPGFWEGLAVGIAAAPPTYLVIRFVLDRIPARRALRPPPEHAVCSFVPPDRARRVDLAPPAPARPAAPLEAARIPVFQRPPAPAPPTPAAGPGGADPVRMSQRVLLHLLRNASVAPTGDRGDRLTQRGIAENVGAAQGALSGVLRRLEDGGALVSERAHVRGRPKRVKVYALTPRGRDLALRAAGVPNAPPTAVPTLFEPTATQAPRREPGVGAPARGEP